MSIACPECQVRAQFDVVILNNADSVMREALQQLRTWVQIHDCPVSATNGSD